MLVDGINYRLNRNLGGLHPYGVPSPGGYIYYCRTGKQILIPNVIFSRRRWKLLRGGNPGERELSLEPIPMESHTSPNRAYGKFSIHHGKKSRPIRYNMGTRADEYIPIGEKYIETPVYLMKNGRVYQHTFRRPFSGE